MAPDAVDPDRYIEAKPDVLSSILYGNIKA